MGKSYKSYNDDSFDDESDFYHSGGSKGSNRKANQFNRALKTMDIDLLEELDLLDD